MKKILYLTLLTELLCPLFVLADDAKPAPTIGDMATALAGQIWLVGTALIVIFWVVTGVLFLTAQGEPGALTKAKMALFVSIAGTIVIILAKSAGTFVASLFGL